MALTIDNLPQATERRMQATVDALSKDLQTMRTDRASSSMLANIKATYNGSQMPIEHLAKVSVADTRQLIIQPWDAEALGAIVRAIQLSDLGITPNIDGANIRLVIPPMSGERRQEIVRAAKRRGEEARIAIRNVRRDQIDALRSMEKEGTCSQDEMHRVLNLLQKTTDKHIAEVATLISQKESRILAV